MGKQNFLRSLEVLGFMLCFTTLVAHAESADQPVQQRQNQESSKNNRRRQQDLILGICAGQKLATLETPIILPLPVRGEAPTKLDDDTKTALKSALDECYQTLVGSSNSSDSATQQSSGDGSSVAE